MKRNRAVLTAVVVLVVAIAGWWLFRRGSGASASICWRTFDTARRSGRRRRSASIDATLEGETKQAIAAPPNGRIIFHVTVPDDGWLKVSLGMKPEAWTRKATASISTSASPTAAPSRSCSPRHSIPSPTSPSAAGFR